jgi:sugar fermentation stimulation protein A
MIFSQPLLEGKLIKRYKRFLADIELNSGELITAHCPNPGAMLGITEPFNKVFVSKSSNPDRKLQYSWEMVNILGTWIGVNTNNPNKLVKEAIENKVIDALGDYNDFKQEVKYGKNSRIDFLLTNQKNKKCFLEVKNVHLTREDYTAEFPDCVTARGAKHMIELSNMVQEGHRCIVLYVVQRQDVNSFKVAKDLDHEYFKASTYAKKMGVEFLAYNCLINPSEIRVLERLEMLG